MLQLDIMLNGNLVEEMSTLVHLSKARETGKRIAAKLKDTIDRHQFQVNFTEVTLFRVSYYDYCLQIVIQAAVGSKVLAREETKAVRKDVSAKLVIFFN